MTDLPAATRAVILDVDGVVSRVVTSPVSTKPPAWADEVIAGHVLGGPVPISPTLCTRLDQLNDIPGVQCWWLTSWTAAMRAGMHPFPGRDWPAVAEQITSPRSGRRWWKLDVVETWLTRHPEVAGLAWCDDQLRGGRPAVVRRLLAARGLQPLLLAPQPHMGLTPRHLDQLVAWAQVAEPTGWVATDETALELRPGMTGRWQVTTQGTIHIWDLDAMTSERHPGPTSRAGSFEYDGMPLPITRVERWPKVGARSFSWFDDPELPELLERYRVSSTITEIRRLAPTTGSGTDA